MTEDPGRIAVPTNGRRPHPAAPPVEPPLVAPETGAGANVEATSPAVTPMQLAVGFGIVASLVLLILGRARRRRPGD